MILLIARDARKFATVSSRRSELFHNCVIFGVASNIPLDVSGIISIRNKSKNLNFIRKINYSVIFTIFAHNFLNTKNPFRSKRGTRRMWKAWNELTSSGGSPTHVPFTSSDLVRSWLHSQSRQALHNCHTSWEFHVLTKRYMSVRSR